MIRRTDDQQDHRGWLQPTKLCPMLPGKRIDLRAQIYVRAVRRFEGRAFFSLQLPR